MALVSCGHDQEVYYRDVYHHHHHHDYDSGGTTPGYAIPIPDNNSPANFRAEG